MIGNVKLAFSANLISVPSALWRLLATHPVGLSVRSGPRRTFQDEGETRPPYLGRRNYRTSAVSAPGPVLIGSYRSFPCVAPISIFGSTR